MQIFIRIPQLNTKVELEVESSDTIYKVKTKIQVKARIPRNEQCLFFAQQHLQDTSRTLADYGIRNKSTLHLQYVTAQAQGYCAPPPCIHFVDLENNDALQRIAFTYGQGQSWCKVMRGLNIEGKCTRSSCTAYVKRVICPQGFRAFDITRERSICPECGCSIVASTCGFSDCEWMYSGRKRGSAVVIKSEWQVAGDEYERFREAGNVADWEVLIIRARPHPSPRPECVMCLRNMLWEQDHESLECGCRFHRHCVASWKLYETHCPTCRVEMWTPITSSVGTERTPDISMEDRSEIMPNISTIGTRPETGSRFWRILTWLNLVSNSNWSDDC